jgi:aldehyde dehydrogenase (NAD+)
MEYSKNFKLLKDHSWRLRKESTKLRKIKLQKLLDSILSHESEIITALQSDFKKSPSESLLTEILPTIHELKFAISNLDSWTTPQKASTPLMLIGSQSFIKYEPKGTVLIISPWNYPFQLSMGPLIPAIAAGNNVILKPSEFTPHVNQVVKKICNTCFNPDEVLVVEGDASVTTELLKLPFDHIFFTGSTEVGKIVMRAAADNLCSVTLELGGKSPAIVDETANLDLAAEKITWGKSVNSGQTCVAPDYVYAHESIIDQLIANIEKRYIEMYGTNVHNNADYPNIITPRHHQRLTSIAAELDRSLELETDSQKIPLAIFKNPRLDSRLMKEEIFGPLLPVISYTNIDQVVQSIQSGAKPLALYLFTQSEKNEHKFLEETSSGGVLINDVLLHLINHNIPFGGVGSSGLGSYHGIFGFKTFSHEKAVLIQGWLGRFLKIIYAPYTPWKENLIRFLIKF